MTPSTPTTEVSDQARETAARTAVSITEFRWWKSGAWLITSAGSRCDHGGNEDTSALYPSMVEVLDSAADVRQAVALGVELHLALRLQDHQLAELGVVAHEAAHDRDLGEDDVDGRDLGHAAVADHDVGAALPQHLHGLLLGSPLPDEVDHDVSAATGEVPDSLRSTITSDDLLGTQLTSQRLGGGRRVDGHYSCGAEVVKALQGDVTQATDPLHNRPVSRS